MTAVVDTSLHLEQLSVHGDHAGKRLGARLIEHLCEQASALSLAALTLTTFREVPWNAPYYERLGFFVLDETDLTPGLAAIRREEAALGLDRWPRVCMQRNL